MTHDLAFNHGCHLFGDICDPAGQNPVIVVEYLLMKHKPYMFLILSS
jgi:hypothetical protein